ncbi:MAG: hypothetical protein ACOXZO_09095 [Bacteroidales bacterium]|jgi:hypothetical protein
MTHDDGIRPAKCKTDSKGTNSLFTLIARFAGKTGNQRREKKLELHRRKEL